MGGGSGIYSVTWGNDPTGGSCYYSESSTIAQWYNGYALGTLDSADLNQTSMGTAGTHTATDLSSDSKFGLALTNDGNALSDTQQLTDGMILSAYIYMPGEGGDYEGVSDGTRFNEEDVIRSVFGYAGATAALCGEITVALSASALAAAASLALGAALY